MAVFFVYALSSLLGMEDKAWIKSSELVFIRRRCFRFRVLMGSWAYEALSFGGFGLGPRWKRFHFTLVIGCCWFAYTSGLGLEDIQRKLHWFSFWYALQR